MNTDAQIKLMREISTRDGFTRKFYQYLRESKITQQQAFDKLNEQYEQLFGKKRYSNFESYRKTRDYQLRKG